MFISKKAVKTYLRQLRREENPDIPLNVTAEYLEALDKKVNFIINRSYSFVEGKKTITAKELDVLKVRIEL